MVMTADPPAPTVLLEAGDGDVAVLDRVRCGDLDAFGVLYERDVADAERYASRLVGSADAGDVVAEAFTRVLSAIVNGAGPRDHHLKYLLVAVRHTAWDRLRQARAESIGDREAVATERADEVVDRLLDDDVQAAFDDLSPRWQRVVWLVEVAERSMTEVGDELGVSPAAAAALAYRARTALRVAYDARTRTV